MRSTGLRHAAISSALVSVVLASASALLSSCQQSSQEPPPQAPATTCLDVPKDTSPNAERSLCFGSRDGTSMCVPLPASAATSDKGQFCFEDREWDGDKYVSVEGTSINFGLMVNGKPYLLRYLQDTDFERGHAPDQHVIAGGRFRIFGAVLDGKSIIVRRERYIYSPTTASKVQNILVRTRSNREQGTFVEATVTLDSWLGNISSFNPLLAGVNQGTGLIADRVSELRSDEKTYRLVYAPGARIITKPPDSSGRAVSSGNQRVGMIRGFLVDRTNIVVFEEYSVVK